MDKVMPGHDPVSILLIHIKAVLGSQRCCALYQKNIDPEINLG